MAEQKDGGPAFPRPASGDLPAQDGISVRDYFAGQALAGLAARMSSEDCRDIRTDVRAGRHEAHVAYNLADSMLKERER